MWKRRKIVIGNLVLDCKISPVVNRYLARALEFFRNPGRKKNKMQIDVLLCSLGDAKLLPEITKKAGQFIKNFKESQRTELLTENQMKCLDDAFEFWGRSSLLQNFFSKLRPADMKSIIVYPLDSAKLIVLDPSRRKAFVLISSDKSSRQYIDFLNFSLQFVISVLAPRTNSFLLHSSCLKIGNKGHVFIGDSGSGKTTVSKMILKANSRAKILADDSSLIAYEYGCFKAYRLPIFNKNYSRKRSIRTSVVSNAFILKKSVDVKIENIDGKEVMLDILSNHCINSIWTSGIYHRELIAVTSRFVRSCKPEVLYFKKNSQFMSLLD